MLSPVTDLDTYQGLAGRASPGWPGDLPPEDQDAVHGWLSPFHHQARVLGRVRRAVFHREFPVPVPAVPLRSSRRSWSPGQARALHAVLGLAHQAGCLGEGLLAAWHGSLDEDGWRRKAEVHLGDAAWSLAEGCSAIEVSLSRVATGNVHRCRAQFPAQYEQSRALDQDREAASRAPVSRVDPVRLRALARQAAVTAPAVLAQALVEAAEAIEAQRAVPGTRGGVA